MHLTHRDANKRIPIEWHAPRQRLVEDDTKAIEIGAPVERLMEGLFRGKVVRGTHNGLRCRQLRGPGGARNAEVRHLRAAPRAAKDVVRLDVAVD